MKALFSLMSPAGESARLSILIFHRVVPVADELFPEIPDANRFEDVCRWIGRWFNILPLSTACRLLKERALPARALSITFDDGYADNHDVALPILLRNGLTATYFVSSAFLDGGRMWNDTVIESVRGATTESLTLDDEVFYGMGSLPLRTLNDRRNAIKKIINTCKYLDPAERERACGIVARAAGVRLPEDLMMRSDQIVNVYRAGIELGGHTEHHPILAAIDRQAARREIEGGKKRLEELIQTPVTVFAYPNGQPGRDYNSETITLVREAGFTAAVSTAWGAASGNTDQYQLPRFTPWDRLPLAFGLRMALNLGKHVALLPAHAE